MAKCQNCGTALTCSCKVRTLANGKKGCTKCVNQPTNVKTTINVDSKSAFIDAQ